MIPEDKEALVLSKFPKSREGEGEDRNVKNLLGNALINRRNKRKK